ncbi:Uncharacterised protein [uncultured archaeon]|nr:Uncharacterised protein [uncultured archaeon]
MEKIVNYNCDGICIEETCSQKYTRHTTYELKGMKLKFAFCEKHAEEFEKL